MSVVETACDDDREGGEGVMRAALTRRKEKRNQFGRKRSFAPCMSFSGSRLLVVGARRRPAYWSQIPVRLDLAPRVMCDFTLRVPRLAIAPRSLRYMPRKHLVAPPPLFLNFCSFRRLCA